MAHPHVVGFARVNRWDPEMARVFDTKGKELTARPPHGPLANRCYSVINTAVEWLHEKGGTRDDDFALGIGRGRAVWLKATAAIAAVIRRPSVFDYAAPVLMFLFAVLSLILRTVHGPGTAVCV
jgi:hypothetical protein